MHHHLKIKTMFLERITAGEKTFEVRKNDRDFQVGDELHLCEWFEDQQRFGDEHCMVEIVYIHTGLGMLEGYCVLGIKLIEEENKS